MWMVTREWEGLLTLPSLAAVLRCVGDKLFAVPDGPELLGKRKLILQVGRRDGKTGRRVARVSEDANRKSAPRGRKQEVSPGGGPILTNSPSSLGIRTFISELLAVMTWHLMESLLRYTWQPSVLLMEMVGTFPMT